MAPIKKPSRPASFARELPARVAGWAFILTGFGHALATMMPPPDSARATFEAMEGSTFSMAGVSRSLGDLMTGFSAAMLLLFIGFGATVLLLLRRAGLPREIAWVGLALSAGLLILSVLFFPPPPIASMTVATAAFALSLRRGAMTASP